MKMSQESASVNIQEFAFKPKEKLPTVSRYSQLHWHFRLRFMSANLRLMSANLRLGPCILNSWCLMIPVLFDKGTESVTMALQWDPPLRLWIWQEKTVLTYLLICIMLTVVNKWHKEDYFKTFHSPPLNNCLSYSVILSPFEIMMTVWRTCTRWRRSLSRYLLHRMLTIQVSSNNLTQTHYYTDHSGVFEYLGFINQISLTSHTAGYFSWSFHRQSILEV